MKQLLHRGAAKFLRLPGKIFSEGRKEENRASALPEQIDCHWQQIMVYRDSETLGRMETERFT